MLCSNVVLSIVALCLPFTSIASAYDRQTISASKDTISRYRRSEQPLPDYCFESQSSEKSRRKRSSGIDNSTASSKFLDDDPEVSENTTEAIDISRFSKEFLGCTHIMIEYGCYELLRNGSVYIPIFNLVLNESDFYIKDHSGLYICQGHMVAAPEPKFPQTFGVISQVGIGISIACILFHMIMFFFVPAMQNLPGYCLVSLCISLLIAYVCYFVRDFMHRSSSCSDLGMLMFYFFLASFFWMNVLSYDVWRSLRMATCKLRIPTHVWLRFGMYSLYAWGSSILVVVIALVIDSMADVSETYKLTFNVETCWFAYKQALLVYFAFPLFSLLFLNLVFFIWSFVMITSASMQNVENRDVLWSRLCIFLRLFIIMGLTWIFGVVGAATNWITFWYLFVIFNTSQGVLIFFSFTFGEKTKKAWNARLRGRKSSCTPTQSSIHSQNVTTSV